ncbi:recombinase family protein [Qipengyuania seohaensis]|uniref:recombinase family protein n=1 Tax=Qipengyuania seohaensis TaxID=266951 RepID=UPI000C22664F|nr:recombinase family protein [Qipengyuania seohaensis]
MMIRKLSAACAPRIAIYGRHSTDKQNPLSSTDQAAACMPLVQVLNGQVVATYLDSEISGYNRNRPGLKRLLASVAAGELDIVICESLDRLARDDEDIAWVGKKLAYDHVQLFTVAEGEIDQIKLAVAGLLGSMFLSSLQQKTLRGMEAAVLAGRAAGGRTYGYRTVSREGPSGSVIRGLREIDEKEAALVRRIFEEFASGLSSIEIVRRLNAEQIPSPRGGEWNPSTVQGDPKKHTGILNNPLYRGQIIWKRREWRKNPNSDDRERRYRMREESEWVRVDAPDLRIINEPLWKAVRAEIEERSRPRATFSSPVASRRRKHPLSGLIRCASCGSTFTIAGKDYYRCPGERERGTCHNSLSIRRGEIEEAALSCIENHLLDPKLIELFVAEVHRQTELQNRSADTNDVRNAARLKELEGQIATLANNMLVSSASPTLHKMLADLEDEKRLLETVKPIASPKVKILPHPVLVERFTAKVKNLRSALDDETIRLQAVEVIGALIQSVTIFPGEAPLRELSANVVDLASYAASLNDADWAVRRECSVMVVAGVGFEPTTFRL